MAVRVAVAGGVALCIAFTEQAVLCVITPCLCPATAVTQADRTAVDIPLQLTVAAIRPADQLDLATFIQVVAVFVTTEECNRSSALNEFKHLKVT